MRTACIVTAAPGVEPQQIRLLHEAGVCVVALNHAVRWYERPELEGCQPDAWAMVDDIKIHFEKSLWQDDRLFKVVPEEKQKRLEQLGLSNYEAVPANFSQAKFDCNNIGKLPIVCPRRSPLFASYFLAAKKEFQQIGLYGILGQPLGETVYGTHRVSSLTPLAIRNRQASYRTTINWIRYWANCSTDIELVNVSATSTLSQWLRSESISQFCKR